MDRFNRQLSLDERQWASDRAASFAKRYEEETGRSLTIEQAGDMLLGTGYRMVDAVASKGPGGDPIAAAYISEHGGDMFRATLGEYKDPFVHGNENGSLTPEQRALPGAIANPALGLAIASTVKGGLAAPLIVPRAGTAITSAGKYAADLSAAYKAAQSGYSLTTGALSGAGISAGAYTFGAISAAALAKFEGADVAVEFDKRFSLLGLSTTMTVGAANGIFGTSMFKWAGIPNKITNVSTIPGAVIRINSAVQGQAAGRAAQAAVDHYESQK